MLVLEGYPPKLNSQHWIATKYASWQTDSVEAGLCQSRSLGDDKRMYRPVTHAVSHLIYWVGLQVGPNVPQN